MMEDGPIEQQRPATLYRRLRGTVWLGPDHLLYMNRQLFAEQPKRFDYCDVQALTLRQTHAYVRWNEILLALGLLSWLLLVVGVSFQAPWPVLVFLGMPAVGILALLALHWRLGPTCACHIRTAVQIEHLRAFTRLRASRPLFYQLRDAIGRAQGADWSAPLSEADRSAWQRSGVELAAEAPLRQRIMPRLREYKGWAHTLLFAALLLSALVSALSLIQLDWLVLALAMFNLAMLGGSLVAALVMQHTRESTAELRLMGWLCTAYLLVRNVISGSIVPDGFWGLVFLTGEFNVWEHEEFVFFIIISMTVEFVLSLFGFYFLARFRAGINRSAHPVRGAGPPSAAEFLGEHAEQEQP